MIQRKQSLFLLLTVFFSLALLFIPGSIIVSPIGSSSVYLVPLSGFTSSTGHYAAITLNFIVLVLAFIAVFIYKKRNLQVKLCYLLFALWFILSLMIAFCPFVVKTDTVLAVENNYSGSIIAVCAMISIYLALRYIKKDIALLKSADRIR